MYYETKMIGGRLCWRDTPGGEWIAYTDDELSKMRVTVKSSTLASRIVAALADELDMSHDDQARAAVVVAKVVEKSEG